MKKIEIYDTTLRDGSQAEDIAFSVEDKLRITERLDEFGIHFIEGGWPGSNPKETEFFKRAQKLKLKNARLVAFGSTCRPRHKPSEDPLLKELLEASTEIVTIFGKTWDFHVKEALKCSLDENLRLIYDSIYYLKKKMLLVFFDAEHFF